jgi:hypothetical protein
MKKQHVVSAKIAVFVMLEPTKNIEIAKSKPQKNSCSKVFELLTHVENRKNSLLMSRK